MEARPRERIQYFARPDGHAYHIDRDCPRLAHGAFEAYGYTVVGGSDIRARGLTPCTCVIIPAARAS